LDQPHAFRQPFCKKQCAVIVSPLSHPIHPISHPLASQSDLAFQVGCPNHRRLIFLASSPEEKVHWVRLLTAYEAWSTSLCAADGCCLQANFCFQAKRCRGPNPCAGPALLAKRPSRRWQVSTPLCYPLWQPS
jgi:hypothetical protein